MAGQGPSVWGKALALVGLTGLAVTQPVLDLMGRNPEFFVAGRYSGGQIVAFGLVVALIPSVALVAVFLLGWLAHRRVGDVLHLVLLALLGGLFGNVLIRGLGLDAAAAAVAAGLVGAVVVTLLARARAGHLLLQYLALANVFFLVGFLVISPTSRLIGGSVAPEALGSVSVPELPGPVLVIVFDELPISTLMRSDGTINAERYPGFARLAAESTWFRNASSLHHRTERAVPSLLTGNVITTRAMPTYDALPRNLLALLSQAGPVERYEAFTDMCPPKACEEQPSQPLSQALEDAFTVYEHRVLPPGLREDLPRIDDAWGAFGDSLGGVAPAAEDEDDLFGSSNPLARYRDHPASERAPATQLLRLVEQVRKVDARPILHFVHVVVPHSPWFLTPWGTRLMGPMPDWIDEPGAHGAAWSAQVRYQRHSLQVGAVDVALSAALDELEESGAWDDTTVVVTADHGTSTMLPNVGREPTDANEDEVLRVPLFLKRAGQQQPEVVDDVATTLDLLPTLIDLFGIETDWDFEGHSLLDGSAPTTEPYVSPDIDALYDVVRHHEADFPHGIDWTALAAVGQHGALVGRPLAELDVGAPSDMRWAPTNADAFASLPTDAGEVPQLVLGTLSGAGDDEPPPLVIVANGTVAGVTGGYVHMGADWQLNSVLGPYLVDGANEIAAYEVTTVEGRPVLHLVGMSGLAQ